MRTPQRKERGTTIVEMAVTATLTVGLLGALAAITATGYDMFSSSTTPVITDRVANRTLHRLARAVKHAGRTTITPSLAQPDGSSTISFRPSTGFVDGAQTFGNTHTIRWEQDPSDPDDGIDNNGNEIIDEGIVVLIRNVGEANESRAVLARGVTEMFHGEIDNNIDDNGNGVADEKGLSFDLVDRMLTIHLSLAVPAVNGGVEVRTVTSRIALRN